MMTLALRSRSLLAPGVLLASLLAAPAFAQDSDADGVADAADAYPCDATRASVSYFPGATSSALLAFEDQWPNATDVDYNDVAVRAHYRLERNAAGNVVQLHAVLDPVALGGDFSNGLGLQLPTSRTGVTVRRRIGGGSWQTVSLESDANATMVVSPNLRELFGNATGRINSVANQARVSGQRLELEVTFSPAASIASAAAPFDVFAFRAGNLAHQIHFPQYSGTAAMNPALFNTDQDGSTSTRRFVHVSGVPAALNLMTTTRYPLEGVGISALFPDIAGFASSGGTQNAAFYASNVVTAQGHDVAALALPAVAAASTTCVSQVATTSLLVHLDAANPSSYPGSGTTWFDLSGNGNHFTLFNGVTWNAAAGTLSFDGVNDFARSAAILSLSGYSQVLVEMYARSASTVNSMLFEHTTDWNTNAGSFGLSIHVDGFTNFPNKHHTNQSAGSVVRNFNANIGTSWAQHVQLFSRVPDATGRLAYVNGARVGFVSDYNWGTSTDGYAASFANAHLYLGSRGGALAFFPGQIGVVRIYGTKLSDGQVSSNFQANRGRYGL